MTSNTKIWLHGMFAALIGGGASAVTGGLTVTAIAPQQFNLAGQFMETFKLAVSLFVINGFLSLMAYLKQSPLPVESVEISETKTTNISVTPKETP